MWKRKGGFTLLELMLVVAIIGIIAAIAIPGLMRARMNSNEAGAAASLRSIATSQSVFRKTTSVDQDSDGVGEYGVFNELTGSANRRGIATGPLELPRQALADLTISLEAGNCAAKAGYHLQMFLPGPPAGVITDNPTPVALVPLNPTVGGESMAIQAQEENFICYAWPIGFRLSGMSAFVCNQGAEVYKSANLNTATNSGYWQTTAFRPVYNSAMSTAGGVPDPTNWQPIRLKDNTNIVDSNHTWFPVE